MAGRRVKDHHEGVFLEHAQREISTDKAGGGLMVHQTWHNVSLVVTQPR